jgi:hypothetical protein
MYVPILATERSQLAGLAATSAEVKAGIAPLFEVLPTDDGGAPTGPGASDWLAAHVDAIAAAWGCARPAYLDCRTGRGDERLPDGRVHLAALLDHASARELPLVPVTGLRRPTAYQLAVADAALVDDRGACLRLELPDFRARAGIERAVECFFDTIGLEAPQIDLVVDLDDIGDAPVRLLEVTVRAVLGPLARLAPWRSVTIAGSAASLNGRSRTVARTEWLLWRALAAGPAALGHSLRFGDYGARWLADARGDDGRWLYYTHDAEWLVVDAARPGAGRGSAGLPGLRDLARQPEFHGAGHCAGDACFVECRPSPRVDPTLWRAAATTHHLTMVVEQLAGA